MLPIPNDQLSFSSDGRQSVETRMKLLHGDDIKVIKGKGYIGSTAGTLIGRCMEPTELYRVLGQGIYPDWCGEPNQITEPAELIDVESNRASTYLVFKPAR